MWKNTDPREELMEDARIVIVKPSDVGGQSYQTCMAWVEKEFNAILTSNDDIGNIIEEIPWDNRYWWCEFTHST